AHTHTHTGHTHLIHAQNRSHTHLIHAQNRSHTHLITPQNSTHTHTHNTHKPPTAKTPTHTHPAINLTHRAPESPDNTEHSPDTHTHTHTHTTTLLWVLRCVSVLCV